MASERLETAGQLGDVALQLAQHHAGLRRMVAPASAAVHAMAR
jgi:hypothetical protein